jgi:elongation factor G
MSVGISPRTNGDRESLQRALSILIQQDPTITIKTESIDGQTIVNGMGESHLEVICTRISHDFSIQIDVGPFMVIYLETLRGRAEAEGRYVRQTGGCGNYGHVKIRLEPNKTGEGFEFINDINGGIISNEYIHPIEQGIRDALQGGVLAGYEVVDVEVTLLDGSYHAVDSNEMAFRIAGSMACKDAMRKARPVLLEPIMAVEVVVPEEYIGTFIGDLNARRGRIEAIEHRAESQVISASVPLSEMFGYGAHLETSTQGRCDHSIRFARYEEAPHGGHWGGDEPGVTANMPKRPRGSSGSAAAKLYEGFE